MSVLAGSAWAFELQALTAATGLPYVGAPVVDVRDITAGTWWDATAGAWVALEPATGDLLTTTSIGNGAYRATLPAAGTTGLAGHRLEARLLTTRAEASEVLISSLAVVENVYPAGSGAGTYTAPGGTAGASTTGRIASDLIAEISTELSDPRGRRFPPSRLLTMMGDAQLRLAERNVFRRTDVHVPAGGVEVFPFFAPVRKVLGVEWEGNPLAAASETDARRRYGPEWRSQLGRPALFVTTRSGVRPVMAIEDAGTSIVFAAASALGEAAGLSLAGDGYTCAKDATGAVIYWQPGDGVTSNGDSKVGNLRVHYAYQPSRIEQGTRIPEDMELALKSFCYWRCLRTSPQREEQARASEGKADWLDFEGLVAEQAETERADVSPRIETWTEF